MKPIGVTSKASKREGVIVKFFVEKTDGVEFKDSLWAVVIWDESGDIELVPVEALIVER